MLSVETVDGTTLVRFDWPAVIGEADIRRMGEQLIDLIRMSDRPQIVLDLSNARRVSSQLLNVLVEADREAKASEGRIAMAGIKPELANVLHLTGLDWTLNIYAEEGQAMDSFSYERAPVSTPVRARLNSSSSQSGF